MGCLKRSDSSGVYVAEAELQMHELISALGPDVGSVCPSANSSAGQQHGIKRIFWVFECPVAKYQSHCKSQLSLVRSFPHLSSSKALMLSHA